MVGREMGLTLLLIYEVITLIPFHFEEAKKFQESLMKFEILDWDQPRCYLVLFSIKRDP